MKKTITLVLALLVFFSTFTVQASPEIAYDGVSVIVGGTVEDANPEEPVAIIVVNPTSDGLERDVTEIENANSQETYGDILEYIGIVDLDDESSFGDDGHKINLSQKLRSGICAVYINFFDKDDLVKIGTFEHINAEELAGLVQSFNDEDADYSAILTESNLDILSSVGVDGDGYASISDKERFYGILKSFIPFADGKPNENMSATLNFSVSFNEALALEELFESEDTLDILTKYNTKYWTVAIDEDDDFTTLGKEAKNAILEKVRLSENTRGKTVTESFLTLTGLSVLRDSVIVKGDVEKFILNYCDVFGLDKDEYLDDGFSDYDRADICNYILEYRDDVAEAEDVLELYNDAIESIDDDTAGGSWSSGSSGGSGGSWSSGGGSSYKPPVIEVTPKSDEKEKFPFVDVDNKNWAYTYIKRLYDDGVVSGKTSDSFCPEDMVTREEFIKIIAEALNLETGGDVSFADVKDGAWYKPYVAAAVSAGLIQGKEDGTFGVGDKLSRQDAAVILSRALTDLKSGELVFDDKDEIFPYALEAISAMVNESIITGYEDGTFKPQKHISRAESCAIICRLLDKRGGEK